MKPTLPRRLALVLAHATGLAACGGSANREPQSSGNADPRANTAILAPDSNETPRADAPRTVSRVQAANDALTAIDGERDDTLRGRFAAVAIGEAGFGLPPGQLAGLKAIGGGDVAPSRCSRILAATLLETAKPLVDKRCGEMNALSKKVMSLPAAKQTTELVRLCKIESIEAKDLSKLNAMSVLTSAVVEEELAGDPQSSPAEKKLARFVAFACPIR